MKTNEVALLAMHTLGRPKKCMHGTTDACQCGGDELASHANSVQAQTAEQQPLGPKQQKYEGRQICCMAPTRKKRTTRAIAPGFASSIPAP